MKKIFKAILAIGIIGAMALGFAACGGNGGSDAIAVISREEGSGTRGAFVELTGVEVDKVDKTVATAEISSSTAVVMQTVAGNKAAIGYISLGSLDNTVKAVKVDGVEATADNVKNGTYPICRPFNIATKGDLSDAAKDFIAFIQSDEGQQVITDKGCVSTGSTGAFADNAEALGIDLTRVDTVVLSHGHYDHAGGLLRFAALNPGAPIYLQAGADGDFYHGDRYIGIDKAITALPQVRPVRGDLRIDGELFLFAGITGRRFWPQSNLSLRVRRDGQTLQDDFSHEQCLVVSQDGHRVLVSGCAHNGILNILDRYRDLFGGDPDVVISGFHMMKKQPYDCEELDVIDETARELARHNTVFYTGHCTGLPAFERMQTILGEQLRPLHSGVELDLATR